MFPVHWTRFALNQLADIWAASVDRLAVTLATERVEQRLCKAPEEAGESRDEDRPDLLRASAGRLLPHLPG